MAIVAANRPRFHPQSIDYLARLRGFEPLTSGEQGPARCDAAVAVFHGLPPEARLSILLDRSTPFGRLPVG